MTCPLSFQWTVIGESGVPGVNVRANAEKVNRREVASVTNHPPEEGVGLVPENQMMLKHVTWGRVMVSTNVFQIKLCSTLSNLRRGKGREFGNFDSLLILELSLNKSFFGMCLFLQFSPVFFDPPRCRSVNILLPRHISKHIPTSFLKHYQHGVL